VDRDRDREVSRQQMKEMRDSNHRLVSNDKPKDRSANSK
jgi:hypothetical protein